MTILFFLKPHYPQKIRAELQRRILSKKRRKRVYKILRTTTQPQAEEINYFDEAQFEAQRSEQRRVIERQQQEEDMMFFGFLAEAI